MLDAKLVTKTASKAQQRALQLLSHRHPEEYRALYDAIHADLRKEAGLPPVGERPGRRIAWNLEDYAEVTA